MTKKSFFAERTEPQIRALKPRNSYQQRNLVQRIMDIDPAEESLIINTQVIPGKFHRSANSSAHASRLAYKHGTYKLLKGPRSIEASYYDQRTPEQLRHDTMDKLLTDQRQENISLQGYAFRPIKGRDMRKRLVPFAWLLEGLRLYAYAEQTADTQVRGYDNALRVTSEGANMTVKIPSRQEKKPRYTIRLSSIPTERNQERFSIWPGFTSTYAEGRQPEHATYSFGYKPITDQESSNTVILYPQDIAADLTLARHYIEQDHNIVPLEMSPFARTSTQTVDFYRTLCNNVLIKDPSLQSKAKTRKPHIAEKSIMLARFAAVMGYDNAFTWQPKGPKLRDYDWSIPQ